MAAHESIKHAPSRRPMSTHAFINTTALSNGKNTRACTHFFCFPASHTPVANTTGPVRGPRYNAPPTSGMTASPPICACTVSQQTADRGLRFIGPWPGQNNPIFTLQDACLGGHPCAEAATWGLSSMRKNTSNRALPLIEAPRGVARLTKGFKTL